MNEWKKQVSLVDTLTRFVMRQHTRRGFLRSLAKGGAAVVAIGVGIGGSGKNVFAQSGLPDPCYGECSLYSSYCYSGGERCFISCPNCCWLQPHQAFGHWYWWQNEPQFSCGYLLCT